MHEWKETDQGEYIMYVIPISDDAIAALGVGTADMRDVLFISAFYKGLPRPDVQYFSDNQATAFMPAASGAERGNGSLQLRPEHHPLFQALGDQVPSLRQSLEECLVGIGMSPFSSAAASSLRVDVSEMTSYYQ